MYAALYPLTYLKHTLKMIKFIKNLLNLCICPIIRSKKKIQIENKMKMFKSRVISRKEPMPQGTIDWLSQVSDRYVIYDEIDPYHTVYFFREGIYNIFEESADGMGDVWLNLIVGPEKALLIDTGFGIGNLKALVDTLTGGMPLIVVNTHQGPDHTMGNCQFGTVYCHEFCYPAVRKKYCRPEMWDYLSNEDGSGIWYDFDRKDIIEYCEYDLVPVKNNHIFDLGAGHTVELIHTPGHAPGGASYLDKKNRILFTGQFHTNYVAVLKKEMPYSEPYGTVHAFRDELIKLVDRIDEYNTVVPAHEILYLPPQFVKDLLEVCNDVLEHPEQFDYKESSSDGSMEIRFKRIRSGSIRYRKESL